MEQVAALSPRGEGIECVSKILMLVEDFRQLVGKLKHCISGDRFFAGFFQLDGFSDVVNNHAFERPDLLRAREPQVASKPGIFARLFQNLFNVRQLRASKERKGCTLFQRAQRQYVSSVVRVARSAPFDHFRQIGRQQDFSEQREFFCPLMNLAIGCASERASPTSDCEVLVDVCWFFRHRFVRILAFSGTRGPTRETTLESRRYLLGAAGNRLSIEIKNICNSTPKGTIKFSTSAPMLPKPIFAATGPASKRRIITTDAQRVL